MYACETDQRTLGVTLVMYVFERPVNARCETGNDVFERPANARCDIGNVCV
jgi:hypothetical protein